MKSDFDPAMDRRFQLKMKFLFPKYAERLQMWEKGLPSSYNYSSENTAAQLAGYKLSLASIINILKGACIQAKKRGADILKKSDIELYLQLEFAKSGLTPSRENIPAR